MPDLEKRVDELERKAASLHRLVVIVIAGVVGVVVMQCWINFNLKNQVSDLYQSQGVSHAE
jgi:hypothetical protein